MVLYYNTDRKPTPTSLLCYRSHISVLHMYFPATPTTASWAKILGHDDVFIMCVQWQIIAFQKFKEQETYFNLIASTNISDFSD